MKTIPVSEFKARCLSVLKEMNETNETVTVTRHGKPYAEIRPAVKSLDDVLSRLRDSGRVMGDIVAPLDVKWEADQ